MNKESKYVVENTPNVIKFVGPKGGDPVPLREAEIKRIFGEVERKEGQELVDVTYKVGDVVKVISGPFIDYFQSIFFYNFSKIMKIFRFYKHFCLSGDFLVAKSACQRRPAHVHLEQGLLMFGHFGGSENVFFLYSCFYCFLRKMRNVIIRSLTCQKKYHF